MSTSSVKIHATRNAAWACIESGRSSIWLGCNASKALRLAVYRVSAATEYGFEMRAQFGVSGHSSSGLLGAAGGSESVADEHPTGSDTPTQSEAAKTVFTAETNGEATLE